MKYLLLVYGTEGVWEGKAAELAACQADSAALCHELEARGQLLSASPLHSVATATSVRVRNGKPLVTDGPFAETTEQLGGYFLVDVENLDEAIAISRRIPGATRGTIEIRPLSPLPGYS